MYFGFNITINSTDKDLKDLSHFYSASIREEYKQGYTSKGYCCQYNVTGGQLSENAVMFTPILLNWCVSSSTAMTCRPPNRRRPLHPSLTTRSHEIKRCALITQHWCKTQGCPLLPSSLHDIKLTQPQRETHTTFCPCSCEQFCQKKKKIHGCLPNRATPSI